MGSKRSLAAAAVLSVGLGGCVAVWGGNHQVTHKDDTSIVIESDPSLVSAEDMNAVANDHCKLRGAEAVLQSARRSIAAIDIRRYRCDRTAAEQKEAVMLLRRAVGRFSARDWAGATDFATKALAFSSLSDNQVAAAYTLRGYCQFALGRLDAAIADLDRALDRSPDLLVAIRLREALVRVQAARQSPRRSVPLPPDAPGLPLIEF